MMCLVSILSGWEDMTNIKWYCSLFRCLSSTAVHIVAADLVSTDSFILPLQWFIVRRDHVLTIWSDNKSNFVDSKNKLKEVI